MSENYVMELIPDIIPTKQNNKKSNVKFIENLPISENSLPISENSVRKLIQKLFEIFNI